MNKGTFLHNHSPRSNSETNVDMTLLTDLENLFEFPQFSCLCLFLGLGPNPEPDFVSSHPGSPILQSVTFPQSFLAFHDLNILEEHLCYFAEFPLVWVGRWFLVVGRNTAAMFVFFEYHIRAGFIFEFSSSLEWVRHLGDIKRFRE